MKKLITLLSILLLSSSGITAQSCPPGQTQIKIKIVPDGYPGEISWTLKDGFGTTVLSGAGGTALVAKYDSICVPNNTCYTFRIDDSFGDGICCAYGAGSYEVFVNGGSVATGGNYTTYSVVDVNCPPGTSCSSAITVSTGNYTAPQMNSWYVFTPDSNGMYDITTCFGTNCNTTVWIYDNCGGNVNNTNTGTIYYDDNQGGCGNFGVVNAALDTAHTYYIRIGGDTSCTGDSILWAINYDGPITGCTDTAACNFNPLATVSDGSCLYFPNTLCGAPDLEVVQAAFETSLTIGNQASDNCSVQEGCLNGYGNRTVINFTTHIKNIGNLDYYIGDPANNPSQFNSTNCHGHSHYEGYAEYVLYSQSGQMVPIGFKNGFCVLDLECSGGGIAQYGCGNMGITSGCGDIYSSGLPCQWVDITTVDPGSYILAIKVNWDQSPDALGRYESNYVNNWAQVCVDITVDQFGNRNFTQNTNCSPYVDCLGVPYGNALIDCQGNCGGTSKMGDLNNNTQQETVDAQQYVSQILASTINPTPCNDLNDDSLITVWDAALLSNCINNGTPNNTACMFPHGIVNPYQTVTLKIDSLNTAQGFIEVSMLAPQSDVTAYEFTVHGIQILNVVSLVNTTDYPGSPNFLTGGTKVIGISYIDSSISRQPVYQKLCRIYYSNVTDTVICIDKIIDIVNSNYEATLKQIAPPCWPSTVSIGIVENDTRNYFLAFPNPSKGQLTLTTQFESNTGTLFIYDVMGKLVQTQQLQLNQKNTTLDISNLPDGIYTLNIKTSTSVSTKRIVLNR